MALPWLEAARFADTDGYQYDGPRYQWRWRDWVIDAYNSNMPFDEFTIEQLAGDLLPDATLQQRIATGFNRNHRYNSESGLVVEEFLLENAVDRVDTTATVWMGLTVGCARCHDHKFDPISQRDYYRLIAFFNSVPEGGRAVKAGNSDPVIVAPTDDQAIALREKELTVESARQRLAAGDKPQNGGLLIDRKLVAHFPLTDPATESWKLSDGATLSAEGIRLDGASSAVSEGEIKGVPLRANSRFSIAFWLKLASTESGVVVARMEPGASRPGIEVSVVEGGRLRFDLVTRWVAGIGRLETREPLPTDEWLHVTVTNDGSQTARRQGIYLNGRVVETEALISTNSNVGGVKDKQPIMLGRSQHEGSHSVQGHLRDLRIYSTDLWPEEVEILAAEYGGERRQEFSRIKMTPEYNSYVEAREELDRYRRTLPTVMVMEEAEAPKPSYIRVRGAYDQLGDQVQRQVPDSLPPMDESLPRDRLGFARWLMAPEHPLTARVAVNRYWQKLFGRGLVETPEDFGVQGQLPSHPELMDWLAVEFREGDWDVQRILKKILMSRTYRQSSTVTAEHLRLDPQNRWLARAPRLRLSGQAIRDQALFVSGLLHEKLGGPSVSPYQPDNLWAEMSMGMKYRQSKGSDLYRRSLYTIWKRTVAPPAMAVFDAADREACWVRRKTTNTPLQALTLMNEVTFVECARKMAERVLRQSDEPPLQFAFRLVTSRSPEASELAVLEQAWQDFQAHYDASPSEAQFLLSVGESDADAEIDPVSLAAMTAVCNLLLNLDEGIHRE